MLFTKALGFIFIGALIFTYSPEPTEIATSPINTITETPLSLNEITPEEEKWETFIATAYCPCEKCCPMGTYKHTKSGAIAVEGITVAADWNVLPFGTEIEIENFGTRLVQDTGGAIKQNRIDIYFESHQDALNFGKQTVKIKRRINQQ